LQKFQKRIALMTALVFLQVVLGAYMRHSGSGLAAGSGSQAAIFPMDTAHGVFSWWPSTLPAQWNVLHRYLGLLLGLLVCTTSFGLYQLGKQSNYKPFIHYAGFLTLLVWTQIGLGVASIWYFLNIPLITLHLGVGTLCFQVFWACFLSLYTQNHPLKDSAVSSS
jgi:heme A synthase